MRQEAKIVLLALVAGLLFWLIDGVVDSAFFRRGDLGEMLFTAVSAHEAYMRAIVLVLFVLLGLVASRMVAGRARAEERLRHLNAVLMGIRNVNQLITQEKDRSRLVHRACHDLVETLGHKAAWIAVVDASGALCATGNAGFDRDFAAFREQLEHGDPPACMRKTDEQPGVVTVDDPSAECGNCPLSGVYAPNGVLVTRLRHVGRDYGAMAVSVPVHYVADEQGRALFGEVASDLAFALHSIDLEEERQRQEEALRRALARNEALLAAVPDIIMEVDADKVYTWANEAGLRFFGEDVIGREAADYFIGEQDTYDVVEPLFGGDENVIYVESWQRRKDGEKRLLAWWCRVIKDAQGNVSGALSTARDITDRKRAEAEKEALEARTRQQQKLESIGTLASGVAHEINNPVNGVMNYAQLILDKLGEDRVVSPYAREIIHEAERVAVIVSNLLTFARQEKQTHSPARPADIVEATLSLIRTIIRHDQINLEIDVPDDLPTIKCRSQQIQQVLMNLLTNARDAVNERYPTYDADKIIRLSALPFEKGGKRWVRITVEDHGSGMPPDAQERIFDPFFTSKDRAQGTGLGLSISHGIVQEHHGELHFETEPGRLTRFHVDLPVDNGWQLKHPQAEHANGAAPEGDE